MKGLESFCSETPWQIGVVPEGQDEGGWCIIDKDGNTICQFFVNSGDGPDHFRRHQINAAMIVAAVNSAAGK